MLFCRELMLRILAMVSTRFPFQMMFVSFNSNTTGVNSGTGSADTTGTSGFTSSFKWGSCYSIFSFMCMVCRSLCVRLSLFFWPLYFQTFFDLRILITQASLYNDILYNWITYSNTDRARVAQ